MAANQPDHASAPATNVEPPAEAARGRIGFGLTAPDGRDPAIDLTSTRAWIDDGLLMVFGPDGDPIPPATFIAAAAEQPQALVSLTGGGRASVDRVAHVLEAQAGGRLGSTPWIMAMLGIGPQPDVATELDLLAEGTRCQLTAFGTELMVSLPGGQTFLIAEAHAAAEGGARLCNADGEAMTLGDLLVGLPIPEDASAADTEAHNPFAEQALPTCIARIEDGALVLETREAGVVRLQPSEDAAAPGSMVSIFLSNGEAVDVPGLLAALGKPHAPVGPEESPAGAGAEREPADPETLNTLDPPPDPWCAGASSPVGGEPSLPIPLAIEIPRLDAADPKRVALIVIGGVPDGAALSAGVDNGDGSWSLTADDLPGLAIAAPPQCRAGLLLQVTAITVRDRDGDLVAASAIVEVPHRAHGDAPPSAPRPIPLAVDPELDADAGAPVDAIVVRDLPAGARLSVGTYDATIDAWVLLPRQLPEAAVTPHAHQTDDFVLTLTGISLRSASRPRLIARVPVSVRQD